MTLCYTTNGNKNKSINYHAVKEVKGENIVFRTQHIEKCTIIIKFQNEGFRSCSKKILENKGS